MKGSCVLELMPLLLIFVVFQRSDEACHHPARSAGSGVHMNGTVRSDDRYPTGTVATHYCQKGYLQGNTRHQQTCFSNGSWSNPNIQMNCDLDPCKRWLNFKWPLKTARVKDLCFGMQKDLISDNVEVNISQCDRYSHSLSSLESHQFITFLRTQHNIMNEFCNMSGLQKIVFIIDKISPSVNSPRDTILFQCNYPREVQNVHWQDAIHWYQYWLCIYNTSCSLPSQNENTEVYRFWDSGVLFARYKCPKGFLLLGSQYRTCQTDGLWSKEAPTCQYLGCKAPLLHGNVSFILLNDSSSNGSWLKQECSPGLVMVSGSPFKQCINGIWEGEPVLCQLIPLTSEAQTTHWWCSLIIGIGIVVGVTAAVIVIIWTIAGVLIWKKRRKHSDANRQQRSKATRTG